MPEPQQAPQFVLDATNLSGWIEPDVAALSGEAGLANFVETANFNALLDAWAAQRGVPL